MPEDHFCGGTGPVDDLVMVRGIGPSIVDGNRDVLKVGASN